MLKHSIHLSGNLILALKRLDVRTSTIDIAVKRAVFILKITTNMPDPFPPKITVDNKRQMVMTISNKKEQNCPKNVIAFVLFLFRITAGSRSRAIFTLLSC